MTIAFRRVRWPFAAAMVVFSTLTMLADRALAEMTQLTPVSVKQFIASFPAVKAVALRHAKQNGNKIGGGKEALAAVIEAATDKATRTEIDAAVQPHGFRDAKEWFRVARSVTATYAHLKLAPDDEKQRRKLEKAIAKIEKNDFLSEKAKAKLIEALKDNAGVVIETPPPGNVAAVQPVVAQIDALVK